MIASYGYQNGSGIYMISIDNEKCNACGACVEVCSGGVFEIAIDPNEPLEERLVAMVTEDQRKKVKYTCAGCKPISGETEPLCVQACEPKAITFSKNTYW